MRSGRSKRGPKVAARSKRMKKGVKKFLRPVQRKAVRQIAKEVIRREAEDKYASISNTQSFNQRIGSSAEAYSLCPVISNGTGDYQRVGDKIRGKYLYVKGMVQIDQNFMTTLTNGYMPPSTVRIMILSQKNIACGNEVSTRFDSNHLLKENVPAGGGTGHPYYGAITDNLVPINKDLFTVHMDRKIRFNYQTLQAFSGGVPSEAWQSGNDRTKYFYCRIKAPSTLYFDDGNGDQPNKFAPFLICGGVNDDGTPAWTAGTPYKVTWVSTLYYEDA